jgi:alpha-amylase/alpha-mannosidase (GH57 family)
MGILRDLSSDGLRFALKVNKDPNSGLKNDTLKSRDEKIMMSFRNVLHSDLVGFSFSECYG